MEIRKATPADIPAIHNLVVELAVYEKEPDAVAATVDDYRRDFEEGIFQALVADDGGTIKGMMLYYTAYSSWKGRMIYLDDFVVSEAYRRQGIGQLLYNELFEEARRIKAVLVKWQVLDWNEPAIRFYKKNHATLETEWLNVKKYI